MPVVGDAAFDSAVDRRRERRTALRRFVEMDSARARDELGWRPRHSSLHALGELLEGLRESTGMDTPPLSPATQRARTPPRVPDRIGPRP